MTVTCVTYEKDYQLHLRGYATVLYMATVLWLVQTGCVAITLCTAFVSPFVYSLTRTTTGDTTIFRLCALFGMVCTAFPTINRVGLTFARYIVVRREKQDDAQLHEHEE